MKQFGGDVLFLDRSDINTDEIIPAKYLTENTKQALKPYLLEDLKLDGFNPKTDTIGKKVIITRENFGCGSSREHAPWVLEVNGIYTVIAVNFARIFRQNMYNCGLLALDMSKKDIDDMFRTFADKETQCKIEQKEDGTWKVGLAMPIKNIEFHSIFFINEFLALPKTRGFIHCLVFIVQRVFSFTENPQYYIQSSIFFINGFSDLLGTRNLFNCVCWTRQIPVPHPKPFLHI